MLKLKHDGDGEIFYATKYSAGFDICANQNLSIEPGCWAVVPTGLRIVESSGLQEVSVGQEKFHCLPEMQIRPRSGLAAKFGITVLNSPSTIDCDYRGEIMVTLINHGKTDFEIKVGDRIAQGICSLAAQLESLPVKDVIRGTNGFGSTGQRG